MSICPRCGAAFGCGMTDASANEPCWCTQLPALPPDAYPAQRDDQPASCFCPGCLRVLVAAQPTLPSKDR